MHQTITTTGSNPVPEEFSKPSLAWEDVMFWIGGYLSALKGKKITEQHIKDILTKFAEADPNQFKRFPDLGIGISQFPQGIPFIGGPQYVPQGIPSPQTYPWAGTSGDPNWVFEPTTKTESQQEYFNHVVSDAEEAKRLVAIQDFLNTIK